MATVAAEPPSALPLLADPLRWQLVRELGDSDRRVGELTTAVGRPQNLVSYHLGQLRDAGLVTSRRSAHDGRDTYYRLDLDRCGEALRATGAALHPGLRLEAAPLPSLAPGRSVLFLCTGNSARSQMAEALVVTRSEGAVAASSAGSHPKALHPEAIRVMTERGLDISGNHTTHLDELAGETFDAVVTLCDKVREVCPEFPGERPGTPLRSHWSMADPAGEGSTPAETRAAFERTADELEARIRHLLARLAVLETAAPSDDRTRPRAARSARRAR